MYYVRGIPSTTCTIIRLRSRLSVVTVQCQSFQHLPYRQKQQLQARTAKPKLAAESSVCLQHSRDKTERKPNCKSSKLVFKACGWAWWGWSSPPQHLGPRGSSDDESRNSQQYEELTQANEPLPFGYAAFCGHTQLCSVVIRRPRTVLSINASKLTDTRVPLDFARSAQTAKKQQLIMANVVGIQRECMDTLGM